MAIKPPAWCSHAVPGPNGWTDPNSGEVFVSKRFSEQELNEYHGKVEKVVEEVREVYTPPKAPQMLNEAPTANKSLDEMSKAELEALGRQHGVELDRRKSKKTLVEKMKGLLG